MVTDSNLTSELLYDVLLAAVANQRRQPEVALDALVRAAYLSRDRQITHSAIHLALQLGDNLQAIELSHLLLDQEPNNANVRLALATAQIRSQLVDKAAKTLLELVAGQTIDSESTFTDVANLVARQPNPIRNQLRTHLNKAVMENHPMVVFTLALIASRLKEKEYFHALLDRVMAIRPDWETAAILKLMHIADHDDDQLDGWATEFLTTNPKAERFRNRLGHLFLQHERLDDALEQFTTVLQFNPESEDALLAAAVIYTEQGKFELAETLFLHYIANKREVDQAKVYLAQMWIDQGRYQDAYPLLRQVLSREYYLEAQIMLAGLIAKRSNVEAGLMHLQGLDADSEEDAVQLILEQSRLLREFNLNERGLALLTGALLERPEHPNLLYGRGLLAAQLDKIDLVEQDMRRLIKLQPENAHAYNALGYTLADRTDRYEEAAELITRALVLLPEDPYILDSMGWLQYRLGKLESALEYLEKAWGYDQDAEIAAHLGEVLWALGRRAEAEEIWQLGIQAGPDNTTLLDTMERFLDHRQAI